MTEARHIVGLGGGGFSMEPDNPLLDDFILSLARRQPARLCFVPTASGDSADFIVKFYRAFSGRAVPSDLTLLSRPQLPRHPTASELERFVLSQDVIYVGGGSSVALVALWRAYGLDRVLRKAWKEGVVLAGISAGLMCWFEASVTNAFGEPVPLHDGLGFLPGSAIPHYNVSPERRTRYHEFVAQGLPGCYAVDDGAALHFQGTDRVEAVSSRAEASAYRVTLGSDGPREERLPTRYLGRARVEP